MVALASRSKPHSRAHGNSALDSHRESACKSLNRIEIRLWIYESCIRLESLSRDPIKYKGSEWNLYEYVNGMPLDNTDPSGELAIAIPAGGIIVVAGVVIYVTAAYCATHPGECKLPPLPNLRWPRLRWPWPKTKPETNIRCESFAVGKIAELELEIESLRRIIDYFANKAREAIESGNSAEFEYYTERIAEIEGQIQLLIDLIEHLRS